MNEYVNNISERVRMLGFQVNETPWDKGGFDAEYKTQYLSGCTTWQKFHIYLKDDKMEITAVSYNDEILIGSFPADEGIKLLAIIGKNSL